MVRKLWATEARADTQVRPYERGFKEHRLESLCHYLKAN